MKWNCLLAVLATGMICLPASAQTETKSSLVKSSATQASELFGRVAVPVQGRLSTAGPNQKLATGTTGSLVQQKQPKSTQVGRPQTLQNNRSFQNYNSPAFVTPRSGVTGTLAQPREVFFPSPSDFQVRRFKKFKPEVLASLREDASIFGSLLFSRLPTSQPRQAMGIAYQRNLGDNKIIYDDNGLTFVFHVDAVLHSPRKESKSAVAENKEKSEWEEMREALRGIRQGGNFRRTAHLALNSEVEYRPFVVDKYKDAVTYVLRKSHNIRGLQKDEYVTVYFIGIGNGKNRTVLGFRLKFGETLKGLDMEIPEKTSYTIEEPNKRSRVLFAR